MSDRATPSAHDVWARLLINPLLGIALPNLGGLIDHSRHSVAGLIASYAWFIAIAFVVWEGNFRLYLRFQDRSTWLTDPWRRVRLLLGLICLFTVPLTSQALWGWAIVTGDPAATPRAIAAVVLGTVAAVVFITHVYETAFLLQDWETERIRGERFQREKAEAELESLKAEISPHTLFNNLNALSHLVEQGSAQAPAFVEALARSYREMLRTRHRRLVPLRDEFELLRHFETLARLRFADRVAVEVHVADDVRVRWCIPPGSLPELLENAIKHNEIGGDTLTLTVHLDGDRLVVSNPLRPRQARADTTGLGLRNLADRFRIVAGVPARWAATGGRFIVTLPLVAAGSRVQEV